MFTKYYKLVRDKVLRRIIDDGFKVNFVKLTGYPLTNALHRKMLEELDELAKADNAVDRLEELADCYEVLNALAESYGFNMDRVLKAAEEKRSINGAFKDGIYIRYTI